MGLYAYPPSSMDELSQKKKKKKIRCISLDNEFAIIFYFHLVLVFHMSLEVLVFHMSLELFFFLF